MDIFKEVEILCQNAKAASRSLALASEAEKNRLLHKLAELLCASSEEIIRANELDLAAAEEIGVAKAMLDRLMINDSRIKGIAASVV